MASHNSGNAGQPSSSSLEAVESLEVATKYVDLTDQVYKSKLSALSKAQNALVEARRKLNLARQEADTAKMQLEEACKFRRNIERRLEVIDVDDGEDAEDEETELLANASTSVAALRRRHGPVAASLSRTFGNVGRPVYFMPPTIIGGQRIQQQQQRQLSSNNPFGGGIMIHRQNPLVAPHIPRGQVQSNERVNPAGFRYVAPHIPNPREHVNHGSLGQLRETNDRRRAIHMSRMTGDAPTRREVRRNGHDSDDDDGEVNNSTNVARLPRSFSSDEDEPYEPSTSRGATSRGGRSGSRRTPSAASASPRPNSQQQDEEEGTTRGVPSFVIRASLGRDNNQRNRRPRKRRRRHFEFSSDRDNDDESTDGQLERRWDCRMCTYQNRRHRRSCVVCFAHRDNEQHTVRASRRRRRRHINPEVTRSTTGNSTAAAPALASSDQDDDDEDGDNHNFRSPQRLRTTRNPAAASASPPFSDQDDSSPPSDLDDE